MGGRCNGIGDQVESCVLLFGGADVGALSVHLSHGGCFGVGPIALDLFRSELGPGIKISRIDGGDPSGEHWGEKSGMVKGNAVVKVGQDGGIGRSGLGEWKLNSVERLGWRGSCAGHDGWSSCLDVDIRVVIEADGAVGEDCGAVVVACGTNGEEGS